MPAWVKGKAADTDAAVRAAADLIGAARTPVIAGLCADAAALRAAYRLAETIGASLDPVAGANLYAELSALSTGGSMTTTAPETLGRADVVLVLGKGAWEGTLVSEIAGSKPVRGRAAGEERAVLSLGSPGNGADRHVSYSTGDADLVVALGHLRAFVRGNLAGDEALGDLAKRLAEAKYGVVIYEPGELGELGVETVQGIVKDLNDKTRFFTLSIADHFQGRAATQLAAWTTGQAPRVGFGRYEPEHDPWRFDSSRQIGTGEADAAIWLAARPAPRPAWLGTLPSLAIVGEGSPEANGDAAEIVITVGVPGETVGGALWNERRGVISYVVGKGATSGGSETTAADILKRIRDSLSEGRA